MYICYMTSPFEIKLYIRIKRIRVTSGDAFCTALSRMLEVADHATDRRRKDHEHELPAPRDHQRGSAESGFVSARDRGRPSAPRHPTDLERGNGRGGRAHAAAESLQDRPRYRPLHCGFDAGRHGRL